MENGGTAIEFPVVLIVDNHASRFDSAVQDLCREGAGRLGIRLFFEESNTSHFLQMLDQINEKCHAAYKARKKEYKTAHKQKCARPPPFVMTRPPRLSHTHRRHHLHRYGEEPDIGLPEFFEILGGCADLGIEGMWWSWCSRTDLLQAWRRVGILGNRLAPDLISRANFIDQGLAEQAAAERSPSRAGPSAAAPANPATPPGMRTGSLAAVQDKLQQAMVIISEMQRGPDPSTVPGLLLPRIPENKKRARGGQRVQEISEGGSASLRYLYESGQERKATEKKKADGIEARKVQRAAAKDAQQQAVADLIAAYERCNPVCRCAGPCPVAGLKRCATCGIVKPQLCRVRTCVAARNGDAPLLLMPPEPDPPPLPLTAPPPVGPPAARDGPRCSFCGPKHLDQLKECKVCKENLLHHMCLAKEYPKAELDDLCKGCALDYMRSLAPQRPKRGGGA